MALFAALWDATLAPICGKALPRMAAAWLSHTFRRVRKFCTQGEIDLPDDFAGALRALRDPPSGPGRIYAEGKAQWVKTG